MFEYVFGFRNILNYIAKSRVVALTKHLQDLFKLITVFRKIIKFVGGTLSACVTVRLDIHSS